MTPEQIKAMPAGPELDYEVHIRMNPEDEVEWRWCSLLNCGHNEYRDRQNDMEDWSGFDAEVNAPRFLRLPCVQDSEGNWIPIPAHSTDWNAMGALLEKMEKDYHWSITATYIDREGPIVAELYVSICDEYLKEVSRASCQTTRDVPKAVAKAAALAKLPKEKENGG